MENVVHEHLKCSGRIGEAKGHDKELEVLMMSTERCLGSVLWMQPDLVVA